MASWPHAGVPEKQSPGEQREGGPAGTELVPLALVALFHHWHEAFSLSCFRPKQLGWVAKPLQSAGASAHRLFLLIRRDLAPFDEKGNNRSLVQLVQQQPSFLTSRHEHATRLTVRNVRCPNHHHHHRSGNCGGDDRDSRQKRTKFAWPVD